MVLSAMTWRRSGSGYHRTDNRGIFARKFERYKLIIETWCYLISINVRFGRSVDPSTDEESDKLNRAIFAKLLYIHFFLMIINITSGYINIIKDYYYKLESVSSLSEIFVLIDDRAQLARLFNERTNKWDHRVRRYSPSSNSRIRTRYAIWKTTMFRVTVSEDIVQDDSRFPLMQRDPVIASSHSITKGKKKTHLHRIPAH